MFGRYIISIVHGKKLSESDFKQRHGEVFLKRWNQAKVEEYNSENEIKL